MFILTIMTKASEPYVTGTATQMVHMSIPVISNIDSNDSTRLKIWELGYQSMFEISTFRALKSNTHIFKIWIMNP